MTEPTQLLKGKPNFLTTETYGLSLIGISALCYSIMAAFVKMATATGLPSTEVVFLRAIFQGSLVVAAMLWYHENPSYSEEHNHEQMPRRLIMAPLGNAAIRPVVVARGAVGGCGFVLYFYTLSVLPLGDAVALLSLSPVVTVWASAAVTGDKMRPLHILAAVTTVVGSVLIARPTFMFGDPQQGQAHLPGYNPLGYVTAGLGTCTGAGVFLLMRKAGKSGAHTLQLLFSWVVFGVLFSFLIGVVLPLVEGGWSWTYPSSRLVWGYILGCCTFGSFAHFLLNFAARHSNPGLASIVRSSGILWAYLLQVWLFDQIPTPLTITGVIFVGMSLTVVSIQKMLDSKPTAITVETVALKEREEYTEQAPIVQRWGYGSAESMEVRAVTSP